MGCSPVLGCADDDLVTVLMMGCLVTGVSGIVVSGYMYIIFLYFILLLLFTHQFPFSGHFLDTLPISTLNMARAVILGRTVVELPQLCNERKGVPGLHTQYAS